MPRRPKSLSAWICSGPTVLALLCYAVRVVCVSSVMVAHNNAFNVDMDEWVIDRYCFIQNYSNSFVSNISMCHTEYTHSVQFAGNIY